MGRLQDSQARGSEAARYTGVLGKWCGQFFFLAIFEMKGGCNHGLLSLKNVPWPGPPGPHFV